MVRSSVVQARRVRTQAERRAETRHALLDACVSLITRVGYAATTTAQVAEEAGVTRGAILHQFGTRADMMVAVVLSVYEDELLQYLELLAATPTGGARLSEWPAILWAVLRRPPARAVMEILQATRGDAELAERLLPMQARIEQDALANMRARIGGDERSALAALRLLVGGIRGLAMTQPLLPDPDEMIEAVRLFGRVLELAERSGTLLVDRGEIVHG